MFDHLLYYYKHLVKRAHTLHDKVRKPHTRGGTDRRSPAMQHWTITDCRGKHLHSSLYAILYFHINSAAYKSPALHRGTRDEKAR